MAVADVEKSSLHIHWKIHGVAHAGFGRIHVAAKFRGDHRTARLAIGRRDSDAAEERMHGNRDGEIRIERLECGRVRGVIDGIEPDALGKRRMQHGGVVGLVDGAKSGSERAHARVAIDLQIENLDGERVAGLRTLDEKWPAQRIVAFDHAERVPGLLERVPKAVQRIGIQDVARLQMRHRFGRGEHILHVVDGGRVVDDVGRLLVNCLLVNCLPPNRLPIKAGRRREQDAQQRQDAIFQLHTVCLVSS